MPGSFAKPMQQLAANLRRGMEERALAPGELAARAGLHLTSLTPVLRGERIVRLDTLVKLAGALGVPPQQLLEGVGWVPGGPPPVTRRSASSRGGSEYRISGAPRDRR